MPLLTVFSPASLYCTVMTRYEEFRSNLSHAAIYTMCYDILELELDVDMKALVASTRYDIQGGAGEITEESQSDWHYYRYWTLTKVPLYC